MIYSIFDQTTGIIIGQLFCSEDTIDYIKQQRSDIIEGQYAIGQFKIVNGNVVSLSTEEITKNNQTPSRIKNIRNGLLSEIDRINPVWYNSLSSEQQQELAQYRQQLLDVPQQAGFPDSVEWPAKPAWL